MRRRGRGPAVPASSDSDDDDDTDSDDSGDDDHHGPPIAALPVMNDDYILYIHFISPIQWCLKTFVHRHLLTYISERTDRQMYICWTTGDQKSSLELSVQVS